MNNNYDFDSQKYMILLVVICSLFAIAVIKAFDFIPENNQNTQTVNEQSINLPPDSDDRNTVNENNSITDSRKETENTAKPKNKKGVLYKSNDIELEEMSIQEIKAPKGVNEEFQILEDVNNENPINNSADSSLQYLSDAKKFKISGDYQNALKEYQKIIEQTKNEEVLAIAYENMAEIYASNKKYGTALSFANKANKLSPSVGREFLAAKIYYAAGDTNNAINTINILLKRSFNSK